MQVEALNITVPSQGETWRWWEGRRLRYNIGLAIAGATAWAVFVAEVLISRPVLLNRSLHISLSLTLGQGLAFLVIMAVANVFYLLGAVSETVIRPSDVAGYRKRMWGLGFILSLGLPFLFPALMLVNLLSIAGL